jgi:DNA mismatch endonuclease (patch repair protein)
MMSGIRSKDTRPEMLIRKGLHALGYRYRLHDRKLPGRPDLVFPKWGAVIFVNGCFWHGHDCNLFRWPSTRADFWRDKIGGNIGRDRRNREALLGAGWRVFDVWECSIRGAMKLPLDELLASCSDFIESSKSSGSIGDSRTVPAGRGIPDG